jgi:eukaryotic-like serine/threonine-protein kinase
MLGVHFSNRYKSDKLTQLEALGMLARAPRKGEAVVDTERDLLFGVVAFQSGAVDGDQLAETCASWINQPTVPLAELLVNRARMTAEQRSEVEKAVAHELATHGDDARATLAATMDGRTLEAMGDAAAATHALDFRLEPPVEKRPAERDIQLLGTLSPGEHESRDRYTLTHLHAKGGMGRVWLARDGALGREIALKDLRPEQTDNSILCSRFLYEAKITAQLEHPGIVPVYEVGQGEVPYYTMRFVKGRTLGEAIRAYHKKRVACEAGSIDLVALLTAFVGVCHAVAYAHSRGVIHRDLKGQNVVLGDFGEVIVLDWGLAKRIGPDHAGEAEPGVEDPAPARDREAAPDLTMGVELGKGALLPDATDDGRFRVTESGTAVGSRSENGSADTTDHGPSPYASPSSSTGRKGATRESGAGPDGTMQGQLLGTPAYMAPEQARGQHDRVDERTDIYGLGAILYEVLTGSPPFTAPQSTEIIRKVVHENPAPPHERVPGVAPALEAICLKALSKDPAGRYRTATELAHEVQRFVADEPVNAYPEPWTTKLLRWARRHRVAVSTAAGLLCTATIALGVSAVLIARERNEAEAQGLQAREAVNLLTQVADISFDEQLDPLQKKFLEKALAYYDNFTSRAADDASVKLEHGRAYQQMGDIQRKLGRLGDSEKSYRRSLEFLEPLAVAAGAGHDVKRSLARTRALLGDLLVRRGADAGQSDLLYDQALAVQQALADPQKNPAATTEDHLRLGQTKKSQADLLRLNGRFAQAKPVFDQAIAELERAHAADAEQAEIRSELALAVDARGWVNREVGDVTAAEADFRRAFELLERLVAEFPTVPRHREVLAKVCNSLGLLEKDTGRVDLAETHLRRQVPLARRLAEDFPQRPEYRIVLGRALSNLGIALFESGRSAESEPILRESIECNTPIMEKSPEDVQVKFYLAASHHNLGEALMRQGNAEAAVAEFKKAQAINEAMTKASPDKPRYRSFLASDLDSLALALNALSQPKVDEAFAAANAIFERLIADHPENVDYRIRQAMCLRNQGGVLTLAGRTQEAEPIYRKGLAVLDAIKPNVVTADCQRWQAKILFNLGALQIAGAEDALKRSIAISRQLLAGKPGAVDDRHNLAIAQNNLGMVLLDQKRLADAGPCFAQSLENFEKLATDAPKAVEIQSNFGTVLADQGKWLDQCGKPAEAKTALTAAVERQRLAMRLGRNPASCRLALASHLAALADVNRKLGAYDEALRLALEVPKTVPLSGRAAACYEAARVLARLVTQVGSDPKVAVADRDRMTRNYLSRTVVLLREAMDAGTEVAEQIKSDPDIKALESRPQFQTFMSSLVEAGK